MIGNEVLTVLIDTGATLFMLNHTNLKQPLPQSTEEIQMVTTSNKPLIAYKSLNFPFQLGSLQDSYSFLLLNSAPVNFLGKDFLEKYHAAIFFSLKREIILEIDLTLSTTNGIPSSSILLAIFALRTSF